MPEHPASDLPILDELGDALLAGYRRERPRHMAGLVARLRARRRRRGGLSLLFATVLVLGAAGAATYYVLHASPIAPFAAEDVPAEQRVAPGTSHVLDLRARDPGGRAPAWALRLASSDTGLVCGTVGQVVDGSFGLVGLDRRFRAVPEVNADACGQSSRNAVALLGARIFDASRYADVRTVINGVAGSDLQAVLVGRARAGAAASGPQWRGRVPRDRRRLPGGSAAGGRPALARRSHAADLAGGEPVRRARSAPRAGVALRFVHERRQGPHVASRRQDGARAGLLVRVVHERARRRGRGELAARLRPARYYPRPDRTSFFATRRLSGKGDPYSRGRLLKGAWNGHAPRTAVWGDVARDLARELVITAPGIRRTVRPTVNGSFLVLMAPTVEPARVRVEVRLRAGGVRRLGPSFGLVDAKEAM